MTARVIPLKTPSINGETVRTPKRQQFDDLIREPSAQFPTGRQRTGETGS